MPREIRLRPRARDDLSDIWDHTVREWSVAQAEVYLAGLDPVLRLIPDQPDIARIRDEFTPPVRIHPYRQHIVIFVADDAVLDVIRILHTRSNWAGLLAEPGGPV